MPSPTVSALRSRVAAVRPWRVDEIAAKNRLRHNGEITVQTVRLINAEGEQAGVMAIADAMTAAEEAGLDLVEIAPQSDPPVCRIMDFGRYRFEQSKKQNAGKKKQKQQQVKEIKFRPGTEDADYQVKLRKLTEFIENGDKAKVTLRFRGREMAHREIGLQLLKRVEADLEELTTVEQKPLLEGRQMVMMLAPKRK